MEKISNRILNKAGELIKEGKVKREFETARRVHFKVFGKTGEHSVIFDKEKNIFSCDCKWNSLKERICSHILASKSFRERT